MTTRKIVCAWTAGVVMALLTSQSAAILPGDVWYAEEGTGLVLIASGDGTVLAQTSGFPADPMAIAVDPNDGSCWVAGKDGRVYHVATDGTHSVLVDLSSDPTGNVPPFDSIALAPAAADGGLYVKSDKYGDWGLYRVLPDGSVPWAVSPGRTTGMHALAVDMLSGNAVCANYGDGSIGVQSYQDGSRLGGYATGTARLGGPMPRPCASSTMPTTVYQGSWTPPICTSRPIGRPLSKWLSAKVRLTSMTLGDPSRSPAVNSRPSSTSRPELAKKSGLTACNRTYPGISGT